jgi:hypothetical protein
MNLISWLNGVWGNGAEAVLGTIQLILSFLTFVGGWVIFRILRPSHRKALHLERPCILVFSCGTRGPAKPAVVMWARAYQETASLEVMDYHFDGNVPNDHVSAYMAQVQKVIGQAIAKGYSRAYVAIAGPVTISQGVGLLLANVFDSTTLAFEGGSYQAVLRWEKKIPTAPQPLTPIE